MRTFQRLVVVESKLLFRDVSTVLVGLLLPVLILVILGAVPMLREPDPQFGGQRFIDYFSPSLAVITMATLGLNTLPAQLAAYREKGVLRRLSATPLHPAKVLGAQLVINLAMTVVAVILLIVAGRLLFAIPVPANLPGFGLAFLLGAAALFAIGLMAAAVAPTARAASGIYLPLFFLAMFFGGVYLPRFLLPDFLARLGEYTPPGVQALLDTWNGAAVQPLPLAIMAVCTVVAGAVAARMFRWE